MKQCFFIQGYRSWEAFRVDSSEDAELTRRVMYPKARSMRENKAFNKE